MTQSVGRLLRRRIFAPPGDRVALTTDEEGLFDLASRLWEPAVSTAGEGSEPVEILIRTFDGPRPGPFAERAVTWTHEEHHYSVRLEGLFSAHLDLRLASLTAWASRGLLAGDPALLARCLLEAPTAVFFGRRAFQVLHAGAVVGREGAVVLRGRAGAGKSTLVAASVAAGLGVLTDESLLVRRTDPDDLAATVRDLTIRTDAAHLLGLAGSTTAAFTGGEEKHRVDLFRGSSPSRRRARRVATFLLGPRTPGPARLVPLPPEEFTAEFRGGAIPQEHLAADPEVVARAWGLRGAYRLDGASDLSGAVRLVSAFASGEAHA